MAKDLVQYPFIDGCQDLPKDKDEEIKQLKSWMSTQPHLPEISDEFLYLFLHSNYGDAEKAQHTIEIYFTSRATNPELFSNRSPSGPVIQSVWDMMYCVPLEKRTPEGYQVIVLKCSDPDISKFNHTNIVKLMNLIQDVLISENGFCEGYLMVQDMTGMTFSHFLKQNFSIARANMKYVQEGLPIRLKGMHVLYAPSFMDTMLNIMRPFIQKELYDLIGIHVSDFTEFYKHVPKEILPAEYGGPNPDETMKVLHERFVQKVKTKYANWVDNENEPKADMSKHPKNNKKSFFSFW